MSRSVPDAEVDEQLSENIQVHLGHNQEVQSDEDRVIVQLEK